VGLFILSFKTVSKLSKSTNFSNVSSDKSIMSQKLNTGTTGRLRLALYYVAHESQQFPSLDGMKLRYHLDHKIVSSSDVSF